MGPVNEPIFDRNENNFIREGWGGKRWEEKGRRRIGREGREEKGRKGIGREGGEEKGRRGMGREGGGRKREGKGLGEKGGEEKGRRGIGREGGRKDSVPVQNKQKTNKIKATTHKHMG